MPCPQARADCTYLEGELAGAREKLAGVLASAERGESEARLAAEAHAATEARLNEALAAALPEGTSAAAAAVSKAAEAEANTQRELTELRVTLVASKIRTAELHALRWPFIGLP